MPIDLSSIGRSVTRTEVPKRADYAPFAHTILNFLERGKRALHLETSLLNKGWYTLRFSHFTPMGMESTSEKYSFPLAKRMFQLRIEKIIIRSGAREEDLLDLFERVHDINVPLRDFNHPYIEIKFKQTIPAPTPSPDVIRPPVAPPEAKLPEPPAGNPFAGKGIESVYKDCSEFDSRTWEWGRDTGKREKFGQLVRWLDYLLENDGQAVRATQFDPKVQEALIKDLTGRRKSFARYEEELQARFPLPQTPAPIPAPIPIPDPAAKPAEKVPVIPIIEVISNGRKLSRQALRTSVAQARPEIEAWMPEAKQRIEDYIDEKKECGWSRELVARFGLIRDLSEQVAKFQKMVGLKVDIYIIPQYNGELSRLPARNRWERKEIST